MIEQIIQRNSNTNFIVSYLEFFMQWNLLLCILGHRAGYHCSHLFGCSCSYNLRCITLF